MASAVPMTDADLSVLLVAAMNWSDMWRCTDSKCGRCELFRRVWWDTYNRLTPTTCENIAIVSMLDGVPYPPPPANGHER